jgi:hypothetical protein
MVYCAKKKPMAEGQWLKARYDIVCELLHSLMEQSDKSPFFKGGFRGNVTV